MKIDVRSQLPQLAAAMRRAPDQVPFALSVAINSVAFQAQRNVQGEMRTVFDRPTPWVLNSLRVERGNKKSPTATVWFRQESLSNEEGYLVKPHIFGGDRAVKRMEQRLQRVNLMPKGWRIVPGEAAQLDAYGNVSRGQISLVLNVLGTYTEAGYNKANAATRKRLAKGGRSKYGVTYFVVLPGRAETKHLQPGIYQRVATPFGSSLKPVLIYVRNTRYRARLDFEGIVRRTIEERLEPEFENALEKAMATAIPKNLGGLL